ncbi:uncharacterized protein LOC107363434 [Tetranychus urticae]|uniref:CUB domain-containing protein n=1 Tax=Tetranychus urticae TaxID=32264 RepID=T1KFS2_TETUR|nr:uncharacterized protein LOC107363434 [Tetranychus urticae]
MSNIMYEMSTINLISVYYFIFSLISVNQIVSSRLYYPEYYILEKCTPPDNPKPINLTNTEGGSAAYFEWPSKNESLIKPTQTCVIVVQSPPGQGLILHPVSLDLTRFAGKIVIYQLHLSASVANIIYDLDDSVHFDSFDNHRVKSVTLNSLPGDEKTVVLFEFQLNSNQSDWNQLLFKFLVTSFIHVPELGHCPDAFYFDCGSGQCIRQSLHCDGISNCADGFDEHDCALEAHEIFFIVLGIFIMLIIVVGLIWYAHKKESMDLPVVQGNDAKKNSLGNTKV